MPRAFKSEERETIRADLLREGRRLFGRHGLRRTTVQDLTRAAGISQGSFYAFFPSKEDLFFEILEQEEAAFFGQLADELRAERLDRRHLKQVLVSGFTRFREHPFLGDLFASGEYDRLRRHIPAARMRRHIEGETALVGSVMAELAEAGRARPVDPQVVVGLLHAFFLLLVHQDDFVLLPSRDEDAESGVLARLIDLLAGLVADHVATQGARNLPK
jgi:AcrR family transcriptional regulator